MVEDNINLNSLGKASFPGLRTPGSFHEDHARVAGELVAGGSIEFSCYSPDEIAGVSDLLPFGMPVFLPVLPRHSLDSRLQVIRELREAGFDPVPHIAARQVSAREELQNFLSVAVREAAVHRVLLIGGDSSKVAGPFTDSTAVLHDGILAEAGIREVCFAGYPEGHPGIPVGVMRDALGEKLELAAEQGLGTQVITQFSFVPSRIIDYCARLASSAPGVPVIVGMAGPASTRQMVHYARYCGVSASLSAVRRVGVKVAQLASHSKADNQLGLLASYCASHEAANVIGVHLFSFGGFLQTAQWMHDRLSTG